MSDSDKKENNLSGKSMDILLELREHPLVRNLKLSIFAVIFMILVSLASLCLVNHPLIPPLVIIVMLLANTSFFMPSKYTFTEEYFIVDRIIYRQTYYWTRFKGYQFDKNGIFLSPRVNTEKFDRFRGVFLVMGSENRNALKPILEGLKNGPDAFSGIHKSRED